MALSLLMENFVKYVQMELILQVLERLLVAHVVVEERLFRAPFVSSVYQVIFQQKRALANHVKVIPFPLHMVLVIVLLALMVLKPIAIIQAVSYVQQVNTHQEDPLVKIAH